MAEIIIGIDPDSEKHGIAIYSDGVLIGLKSMNLVSLNLFATDLMETKHRYGNELLFVIEDVCANKFVYARNNKGNKAVTSKIAMAIGRCQQSQVELMRVLDHYGIKYKLIKPTKGNWAKDKSRFEMHTGWTGRSNEDTRSAAYFGFLGLKL